MSVRWETLRGDEYWYTDYWCKLEAGFNDAYPGILSIDKMEFKPGQLSERRVHELLWSTLQQFKENQIEVCSHRDLLPLLEALQGKGFLEMKPVPTAYSKCVLILRVAPPEPKLNPAITSSSKKQWWRFW